MLGWVNSEVTLVCQTSQRSLEALVMIVCTRGHVLEYCQSTSWDILWWRRLQYRDPLPCRTLREPLWEYRFGFMINATHVRSAHSSSFSWPSLARRDGPPRHAELEQFLSFSRQWTFGKRKFLTWRHSHTFLTHICLLKFRCFSLVICMLYFD